MITKFSIGDKVWVEHSSFQYPWGGEVSEIRVKPGEELYIVTGGNTQGYFKAEDLSAVQVVAKDDQKIPEI